MVMAGLRLRAHGWWVSTIGFEIPFYPLYEHFYSKTLKFVRKGLFMGQLNRKY